MSDESNTEGVIKLEDGDFYKWMYLNEVVYRKEAEVEAMKSQLEMASRNLNALSAAMAKKYSISFEEYGLDVSTQSLVPKHKRDDEEEEDDNQTGSPSDSEGGLSNGEVGS